MNNIITYNDQERFSLLTIPSQMCGFPLTDTDRNIIKEMNDTLDQLGDSAAGLAAVQIGYPKSMFMLRGYKKSNENTLYINPLIVAKSREQKLDNEACLSLPGMSGAFKRPKMTTIKYYDIDGNQHEETFCGFWSRACCHETDHLNGVLIAQHLDKVANKKFSTTKFGMRLTLQKRKELKDRRNKAKMAKKTRARNR